MNRTLLVPSPSHLEDPTIWDNLPVLPEDFQSFPSSQSPIFKELCDRHQPKRIIEVGSWKGGSVAQWATHAGPECKIYCVDTWLEAADTYIKKLRGYRVPMQNGHPMTYWTFLSNVRRWGFQKQVFPLVNTSTIGAQILGYHGVKAPIVYIDGDHAYRQAYNDLVDYWPLVEAGGSMLVDDLVTFPGVYAACLRFIEENQLWKNHRFVDNNSFALFEKPL